MFALTDKNTLLNFNPGQPGMINSVRFITGLSSGENLVGIDFRKHRQPHLYDQSVHRRCDGCGHGGDCYGLERPVVRD